MALGGIDTAIALAVVFRADAVAVRRVRGRIEARKLALLIEARLAGSRGQRLLPVRPASDLQTDWISRPAACVVAETPRMDCLAMATYLQGGAFDQ